MMSPSPALVLEITGVEKRYQALRPLRLQSLSVSAGERVALLGLDAGAAEVLVNLVTGAGLPDRGEVRVLGRATAEISSGDEWLASLDRFGIVSERAVLLEGATLEQNLAMPFTLEIDPIPPDTVARVRALASECGISSEARKESGARDWLTRPAGDAPPEVRIRAHLARAIALDPRLLLLQHPTALIPESGRAGLAEDLVRISDGRALTMVVITQDAFFAGLVAHRTLKLDAASGVLKPVKKGWFW
jgi:ABC-type transporter Mla maintaining outer membrane lipid asymmetry ATPase subunit MlaF